MQVNAPPFPLDVDFPLYQLILEIHPSLFYVS